VAVDQARRGPNAVNARRTRRKGRNYKENNPQPARRKTEQRRTAGAAPPDIRDD